MTVKTDAFPLHTASYFELSDSLASGGVFSSSVESFGTFFCLHPSARVRRLAYAPFAYSFEFYFNRGIAVGVICSTWNDTESIGRIVWPVISY